MFQDCIYLNLQKAGHLFIYFFKSTPYYMCSSKVFYVSNDQDSRSAWVSLINITASFSFLDGLVG